jgi:Flp pilus assembly protein TadD
MLVLPCVCINLLYSQSLAPAAAVDEAAAAFEQGRPAEADQKLNSYLKDHPADLRALILKGAVLDTLQRWEEAEKYYQQALKLAPGSPQALNNAANHYLASGDSVRAREFYLKTVAVDPHHPNANLQLAQMCVSEKKGGQALLYLSRLPDGPVEDPGIHLLRARALALAVGRGGRRGRARGLSCPDVRGRVGRAHRRTHARATSTPSWPRRQVAPTRLRR